jgi:hypothetical protein
MNLAARRISTFLPLTSFLAVNNNFSLQSSSTTVSAFLSEQRNNRSQIMEDQCHRMINTARLIHGPVSASWDDQSQVAMDKCVLPLSSSSHKGSSGRVGVLGGSAQYTGAPYYASMAALKTGSDLAFIFCAEEASLPLKCYSPELMVSPVYQAREFDQALEDGNAKEQE